MCNQDMFVAISYALGAGLIVFGTPCLVMGLITYKILNRIEKK